MKRSEAVSELDFIVLNRGSALAANILAWLESRLGAAFDPEEEPLPKGDMMDDKILAFLREARAAALEENDAGGRSRELSLVSTKIDEAILWRQEDQRLKRTAEHGHSPGS